MAKQLILVTGGAGYIGSHTVKCLLDNNYDVVVLDNLSTGYLKAVDKRAKLVVGDCRNIGLLNSLFTKYPITGIIHFAAKMTVPESVSNPLTYYDNNVGSVVSLLRAMKAFNVKNIVFSSTAAVYGSSKEDAISENSPLNPFSPYGKSKLMAENVIRDASSAYGIKHCIFRYFNVAGASKDSSIGEAHPVECHIIPCIIISQLKNKEFTLFGNDYQTRDGTNLRDYIHVLDLARAHVLGLNRLFKTKESDTFNLGSETGYTNLEIVKAVGQVINREVKFHFGSRRPGDVDSIVASNKHAKEVLDWKIENNLLDMIKDDYAWRTKNPSLYGKNHYSNNKMDLLNVDLTIKPKKYNASLFENIENLDSFNLKKYIKY